MEPLNKKDPKTIGGFTLVGRLGKGGMGVVYLASRKSESVALKVIRDSLIDDESEATRFSREVATLEKIVSPNVAEIIDAGTDDGLAWFAAEFVNGPNLSELVNDKGPLGEDQWWNLARGLLNGLADVHKTGVIHRDIKPANIIMAEPNPKLIDFGIAHISDATSVTATGLVAGSPAWFSPEQIEGFELTSATDVFSAGSALTFAASGESPWGGETTMTKASVFKILTSEPELGKLSEAQRFLLEQMLEKEPSQRPSAEVLIENLEHIRHGGQPDLESAYATRPREKNDPGTKTKRAVPNQTSDATPSTPSRLTTLAASTSSKKRNLLIVAGISVLALIGVSLVVATSSGSGSINISVSVDKTNPALGDFELRLSSSSIEPVTIDLADKKAHRSVFTWKTDEPIRVSYNPPFSEDEEFVGTVMPRDLGLTGFSNGDTLHIKVSLEEASTLLSFRTGVSSEADERYAVRLQRANESLALDACTNSQESRVSAGMALHKSLWETHEASVVEARLDNADERFLTHAVWASRFENLATMARNAREQANTEYSLLGLGLSGVAAVNDSSIRLESAISEIAAYSRRYQNAPNFPRGGWDELWDARWAEEDALRSVVGRLNAKSVALDICKETVQ